MYRISGVGAWYPGRAGFLSSLYPSGGLLLLVGGSRIYVVRIQKRSLKKFLVVREETPKIEMKLIDFSQNKTI